MAYICGSLVHGFFKSNVKKIIIIYHCSIIIICQFVIIYKWVLIVYDKIVHNCARTMFRAHIHKVYSHRFSRAVIWSHLCLNLLATELIQVFCSNEYSIHTTHFEFTGLVKAQKQQMYTLLLRVLCTVSFNFNQHVWCVPWMDNIF